MGYMEQWEAAHLARARPEHGPLWRQDPEGQHGAKARVSLARP